MTRGIREGKYKDNPLENVGKTWEAFYDRRRYYERKAMLQERSVLVDELSTAISQLSDIAISLQKDNIELRRQLSNCLQGIGTTSQSS